MQQSIVNWNELVNKGSKFVEQFYSNVSDIKTISKLLITGGKSAKTVSEVIVDHWKGVMPTTLDAWITRKKMPAALVQEIGSDKRADVWTHAIGEKTKRIYLNEQDRVNEYRQMQKSIVEWNELIKRGKSSVRKRYPDVKGIQSIIDTEIDGSKSAIKVSSILGNFWNGLKPKTLKDWIYNLDLFPASILKEIGSTIPGDVWNHALGRTVLRQFKTEEEKMKAYKEMQVFIYDWNELVGQGVEAVAANYADVKYIADIQTLKITDETSAVLVAKILDKNWNGLRPLNLRKWISTGRLPKSLIAVVNSEERKNIWEYTISSAPNVASGEIKYEMVPDHSPEKSESSNNPNAQSNSNPTYVKNIPLGEKSDEQVEQELKDAKIFFDWWNHSSELEKKSRFSNIEKSPGYC